MPNRSNGHRGGRGGKQHEQLRRGLHLFIAFGVTMVLVNWMTPLRSDGLKSHKGDREQVRVVILRHWHYRDCNWAAGQRCQIT